MPRIALVADAGASVGLGHVARCSAIAAALRARGDAVSCHAHGATARLSLDGIAWQPLDWADVPDGGVVLLDSYVLGAAAVRSPGRRLAVLHDEGEPPAGADLIVSVAGVAAPAGAEVLSGLLHAPLRADYWDLPPRRVADRAGRVLVTTGGGVFPEVALAAAADVAAALPGARVGLVRGPYMDLAPPTGVELVDAPASLRDELLAADIVVTAAGQTALEAAATGAPTLAMVLVANQRANADALAAAGAVRLVEGPGAQLRATLAELAGDGAERAALARRAQAAVDGRGAGRIAARLAALSARGGAA